MQGHVDAWNGIFFQVFAMAFAGEAVVFDGAH